MADTEAKDKAPEEKPKMTGGILACLIFSTAAFVLILVLLFEGKTPADAASRTEYAASAEYSRQPSAPLKENARFSEMLRGKIRTMILVKQFCDRGVSLSEEFKASMEELADAWQRILDVNRP